MRIDDSSCDTLLLNTVINKVLKWINSVHIDDLSPLWTGGKPSLMTTCFSICALECCGALDSVYSARRRELINCIQEFQSKKEGWFEPAPFLRGELRSHSATYIRMQATYFAIHALDALGSRPKFPISLADRLCDKAYSIGWLDGGPWNNPWMHSNNIMFALTFLEIEHARTGNAAYMEGFDRIIDYLDDRQDKNTGLWQPDDGLDNCNAVYAAHHFFSYYFWRGRCPNYIDRIIDSILSIQDNDGLFGGGACEDLDAVHTLVMMSIITDYRSEDIRCSLESCFWRVLQVQNPDGGFSNYVWSVPEKSWKRRFVERLGLVPVLPRSLQKRVVNPVSRWRYSGWKQLECPVNASDMWSAWFRPLTLKLVAERYPDICGYTSLGVYRRIPGLGWHNYDCIRNAAHVNTKGNNCFVQTWIL